MRLALRFCGVIVGSWGGVLAIVGFALSPHPGGAVMLVGGWVTGAGALLYGLGSIPERRRRWHPRELKDRRRTYVE